MADKDRERHQELDPIRKTKLDHSSQGPSSRIRGETGLVRNVEFLFICQRVSVLL